MIRPTAHKSARPALLAALLALLLACQLLGAPGAGARTISFHGRTVHAPASWPVYRLSQHPGMCVRLDRRAVYLGTPSANQNCPAGVIGRRQAILVDPGAARRRSGASASALAAPPPSGASTSGAGAVFTGLGFDACSAPSTKAMSAWSASPYRAIGVYIGGENRGCSQPNLTSSWVSTETAAGWHMIPTYVGLQAPTSSCSSCAKLSASQAVAQGAAAASDAVADASAVAMGPGSPIYFDMESYSQTSSATAATLAFLESWTKKLHSLGYLSGVYSSSASGIEDLGSQVGTGAVLPDDVWIADWNGQKNTTTSALPTGSWANHQRIHQYQGGHNETYGGVTINIDNNYVDASTVGTATPQTGSDNPIGSLELIGAHAGQVRVRGWAFDPNLPTETTSIRVFVGGKAGAASAQEYELGPIANQNRAVVASKYPEAGSKHGFDLTFPTLKSGAQPVCVYAVDIEPGEDRLLGCQSIGIPVAVTLSGIRSNASGLSLRVACAWPTGTACPGQLILRAYVKVPAAHQRGRPTRYRTVARSLGQRHFQLTGSQSHSYRVMFSAAGRQVLREHGKVRTQVIAAIPGGRRIATVGVGG